jgi:replication factor A1
MAKKQFSTLNNEYELGLENGTEIEACGAESAIPQMVYDFVKIADLEKHEKGSNIDVIGVITEDQGVSEIVSKATGKPAKKRELMIVDDSLKSVRLTLWDTLAEEFDSSGFPVCAFKGIRVNDFNGRTLSLGGGGTCKKNPDIPEAQKLHKWYADKGSNASFDAYTSSMMGGDMGRVASKLTLQQAKTQNLGGSDKADYFSFKGTVVFVKSENPAYPGCPECKKKLLMEENGWRCEKCQKTYPAPEYKYILSLSVEDSTSQIYVNGFDDLGMALLKMPANELMALKDNDATAYNLVFSNALFKTYNFKIRAKQETYNVRKYL